MPGWRSAATRANVSRAARAAALGIGETVGILTVLAIPSYSDTHAPTGQVLALGVARAHRLVKPIST